MPLNSREAAAAAGIREATLRQRACRLRTDTALLAWSLIRQSAEHLDVPDVSATINWVDAPAPHPISQAPVGFGPSVTLTVLKHLAKGNSPAEVAAGFLLDEGDVRKLRDCAMDVVKVAAERIWVRRGPSKRPIDLADALEILGLDLNAAGHEKFGGIQEWLQDERPAQLLEDATSSWLKCRRGNQLRLDQPMAVLGFYQLLSTAKVDPGLLRVCVRREASGRVCPNLRAQVDRDFVTAFGIKPRVQEIEPRDRGPRAHLQFDSSRTRHRPHARAGSLQGLDVLMLAIAVHQNWRRGEIK